MSDFLANTLKKIKQTTKRQDNKTFITSHLWVCIGNENDLKTSYIFRNSGELLISENGNIRKSKWEALDFNNFLIEDCNACTLFKHQFVDKNILILSKDNSNDFFTFVDEGLYLNNVKELDQVAEYLTEKYRKNIPKLININATVPAEPLEKEKSTFSEKLSDGKIIEIDYANIFRLRKGLKVYDLNKECLIDGEYLLNTDEKIYVSKGIITSISYISSYNVKNIGKITIESNDINIIDGAKVTLNNKPIKDGKYKLTWFISIKTIDGYVV